MWSYTEGMNGMHILQGFTQYGELLNKHEFCFEYSNSLIMLIFFLSNRKSLALIVHSPGPDIRPQ